MTAPFRDQLPEMFIADMALSAAVRMHERFWFTPGLEGATEIDVMFVAYAGDELDGVSGA